MTHPPFLDLGKELKRDIPIPLEASYWHLLESPFHGLLQMAIYQFPIRSDTTRLPFVTNLNRSVFIYSCTISHVRSKDRRGKIEAPVVVLVMGRLKISHVVAFSVNRTERV